MVLKTPTGDECQDYMPKSKRKAHSGWADALRRMPTSKSAGRQLEEVKRKRGSPKYIEFIEKVKRHWEKRGK